MRMIMATVMLATDEARGNTRASAAFSPGVDGCRGDGPGEGVNHDDDDDNDDDDYGDGDVGD